MAKKIRLGFTLIELLIYTVIVIIFIPLLYGFLGNFFKNVISSIQSQQQCMQTTLILDCIRRDMINADYATRINTAWVFRRRGIDNNDNILEKWISWEWKPYKIIRSTGTINLIEQKWVLKQVSYFPTAIKNFSCIPVFEKNNTYIQGAMIFLKQNNTEYKYFFKTWALNAY